MFIDIGLLLDIFKIPAPSGREYEMSKFIQEYLDKFKIKYDIDEIGNIYYIGFKNTPLLSAHMDTVQDDVDAKLTHLIRMRRDRFITGYGVIGGDDKNGIYIILELLRKYKLNFIFSVSEETGGIGISHFVKNNDISGLPYGLVLDRRGKSDIICEGNSYGTKEFQVELQTIGAEFKYSPAIGTFSDADSLSEQISCANLSVGYYEAHMKTEFVILQDLENALNYVNKNPHNHPRKINI